MNALRSIILMLAVLLVVFKGYASVDYEIAAITKIHGTATLSYGSGDRQAPALLGTLLYNRAVVHTGSDGMVQVRFIEGGTTVLVTAQSRVIFTLEDMSETVNVLAGKALFDGQAQRNGSLDIITPATVTTTKTQSTTLATHEELSGNSALFVTGGTSLITDPTYSEWRPFNAPSAVYVSFGSPFFHLSPLTPGDSTRLVSFSKAARSMKLSGPLTHTLIMQPDIGGSVVPGDTMTTLQGYAVEIAAKPEAGYRFARWEVLDGAALVADVIAESTTVILTTDTRIAARFTNAPARLRIESSGEGRTTPEGSAVVPRYRPWKITAHPFFGYSLDKWTASDGVDIVSSDSVSALVVVNSAEGRLVAEFGRRKFVCDVGTSEGGTVTPGPDRKVTCGDSLRIGATPDKGYTFINWEILQGRPRLADPRSATTVIHCDSSNAQVRARFCKTSRTAHITVRKHECAVIAPCGTVAVPQGEPLPISVRLKEGYEFRQWHLQYGNATIEGTENAAVNVQTNCEIVPEITTKTFTLSVGTVGPGSTVPSGKARVFYATPSTISATPQKGKKFAAWEVVGGDAVIAEPYASTTSVTLATTDAVIAAVFAAEICTLVVDATEGGYVEPADTLILYEGSRFALKAVTNPRAAFLGWSTDSGGKNLEFSDTVTAREQIVTVKKNGNAKIVAHFSSKAIELTILNNGLGTTDPAKSVWVPQEQWTALKAAPAEGNKFLHWVVMSGAEVKLRDRFSAATEINPGTKDATVKALFDTSSGYPVPQFKPAETMHDFQLSMVNETGKGKVDPAGPITLRAGVPQLITAQALSGYIFEGWSVREGTAVIADPQSRSTTVMLTKSNAVVECRFVPEKTHIVKVEFSGPKNSRKTIVIPYR